MLNRIDSVAKSVGRIEDVVVQMGLASASASENLESVLDRLRRVDDRLDTFDRRFEDRERSQAPEGGFSKVCFLYFLILKSISYYFISKAMIEEAAKVGINLDVELVILFFL